MALLVGFTNFHSPSGSSALISLNLRALIRKCDVQKKKTANISREVSCGAGKFISVSLKPFLLYLKMNSLLQLPLWKHQHLFIKILYLKSFMCLGGHEFHVLSHHPCYHSTALWSSIFCSNVSFFTSFICSENSFVSIALISAKS